MSIIINFVPLDDDNCYPTYNTYLPDKISKGNCNNIETNKWWYNIHLFYEILFDSINFQLFEIFKITIYN